MKKNLLSFVFLLTFLPLFPAPGDTTIIQTFSFDDEPKRTQGLFLFPDGSVSYEKILMLYSVRCPCGGWDYLYSTDLHETVKDSAGNISRDTAGNIRVARSWQLGAYVTPYGNGLNLGEDGVTYVYDVSDFVHQLKDTVYLTDGNNHTGRAIQFLFIEGTPPREVLNIRSVWSGTYRLNVFAEQVTTQTFRLLPEEKQAKVRVTVTGHSWDSNGSGSAEFETNSHTLLVNGENVAYWQMTRECSDNPVYPQGGNWLYDRQGWCPGRQADYKEVEITTYLPQDRADSSFTLDYKVQYNDKGSYVVHIELVTYREPLQDDDAAAIDVLAPSNLKLYGRENPMCGKPVVTIKNTGKNILTGLDIHYGFENGPSHDFHWEGNLNFMKTQNITLPLPDWDALIKKYVQEVATWQIDSFLINEIDSTYGYDSVQVKSYFVDYHGRFYFEVSNPNGKTDPTTFNNRCYSYFDFPFITTQPKLRINFKPNEAPMETTWTLRDMDNKVLYRNQNAMQPNRWYNSSFDLPAGGYRILVEDGDDNGLEWIVIVQGGEVTYPQGIGAAIVQTYDPAFDLYRDKHVFNPNFGRYIQYYFYIVDFSSGIATRKNEPAKLLLYPNPSHDRLHVNILQQENSMPLSPLATVSIYNLFGQKITATSMNITETVTIDINPLPQGLYILEIRDGKNGNIIGRQKFTVIR
ncbi:MAG: T9SS type A sorting domain-containing protein [Bacteroidales bacterium]|nr:T9SS type A sorting domain-containing protein [Bacteroidales bacterium]